MSCPKETRRRKTIGSEISPRKFRKRAKRYFKKDIKGRKAFNTNQDLIRF